MRHPPLARSHWHWLFIFPLILVLVFTGTGCSEDEPYIRVLPPVEVPSFDYALYCDAEGHLVGEDSAVLLVRRSAHLERVYADARHGKARARELMRQLEDTFADSGRHIANEVTSARCMARVVPGCRPDWSFVDRLLPTPGPGAQHLRETLGTAFSERARSHRMRNQLITSALGALLATSFVKGPLEAGAAEGGGVAKELVGAVPPVAATTEAELLEARRVAAEVSDTGARHPAEPARLVRFRPSVEHPPAGVSADSPLWADYVAYWERRYAELLGQGPPSAGAPAPKPPLTWTGYEQMQGQVLRGLNFQRAVTRVFRQELTLPATGRRLLRGMQKPLMEENVGLIHPGGPELTYADQLVVDEATLQPGSRSVRVETFSNKSHDFTGWSENDIMEQLQTDANEALTKYGGTAQIRRPGHPLFGRNVSISRVHLVYDAQGVPPELRRLLSDRAGSLGVEFHFHHAP